MVERPVEWFLAWSLLAVAVFVATLWWVKVL